MRGSIRASVALVALCVSAPLSAAQNGAIGAWEFTTRERPYDADFGGMATGSWSASRK